MLSDVPASALHPLTARDASLLPGLRRRFAGRRRWLAELGAMEARGSKCDIEALYAAGPGGGGGGGGGGGAAGGAGGGGGDGGGGGGGFEGLHRLLARRIMQQQYL